MTKPVFRSYKDAMVSTITPLIRRMGLLLAALFVVCHAAAAQGPILPAPVTAAIHPSDVHQPIYGFGGSQTYSGDALADFPNRDAVYKALFQDLKIDILRLRNYDRYPGEQTTFEKVTKEFAGGARKWGGSPATRGGKAPVRLMFTSWSPPPALKSNGRVSGRSDGTDKGLPNGTLARDAQGKFVYGPFADWWLGSVQTFKTLTGVYPDYIALQNELEFPAPYEGCLFLPSEGTSPTGIPLAGYDRALAAVSDRLTAALGAQAPKIVGPETFTLRTGANDLNHVTQFVDPATQTGKADLSRLFGVSFHIYGAGAAGGSPSDTSPALFQASLHQIRDTYRAGGSEKPLFQTEFLEGDALTTVAGIISDMLTEGDVSAYLVWIAARSVKQPGGYALVYYNPDDGSVERRGRFYAVKAFSEFVGEGWRRVGAECADPAVRVSAFLGPDKSQLVAVLINATAQPRRVALRPDGDFAQAAAQTFRSSEGETGEHWQPLGPLPADHLVTLPPRSVATVKFDKIPQRKTP